jgi:hypothetical protein
VEVDHDDDKNRKKGERREQKMAAVHGFRRSEKASQAKRGVREIHKGDEQVYGKKINQTVLETWEEDASN